MRLKSKVLIIAGSDSSGGAGIQADIKTVTSLGSYAMTAITAVTAQNTTGVKSIIPIRSKEISNQIEYSAKDIRPQAIKIGMLHSKQVILAVNKSLNKVRIKKIILDPVMVAKGGAKLINAAAISFIKNILMKKVLLITPNIPEAEILSGIKYNDDQVPFQVIADHIRMLCFSIADGAIPSNEGRGYVLRRILRRAARFGRMLKLEEPFLHKLVPVVSELMSESYPELSSKDTHIELVIGTEETLFNKTLDRGINHFDKLLGDLKGNTISGSDAFRLYDTYGFPLDLTQLIAREKGIAVD